MPVIVENMEMPESCIKCPCITLRGNKHHTHYICDIKPLDFCDLYTNMRHPQCPLKECEK